MYSCAPLINSKTTKFHNNIRWLYAWNYIFVKSIVHVQQTFSEAVRHHQQSVENEWESEKEKILNSLLVSSQDIEFPSESEVRIIM